MVLQLINRLVVRAPIADPGIEPWQKAVSSAVHTSFYVLLFAMPIVGHIANSAYGAPTPFFGLFNLPPIVDQDEALATQLFTIHRWVGWILRILVLTDVGAALYHYFLRRDNVLERCSRTRSAALLVADALENTRPLYAAAKWIFQLAI